MKLIAGLGNPGNKYRGTRHNVGFDVIDCLAQRWQIEMTTEKFHGFFARGSIASTPVGLLKPITFMNRSGISVAEAARFYQLSPADLLLVYDEVAIDLGRLRLRKQGSAGGHNGVKDVILRIGSEKFDRLRVGIGPVRGQRVDFVLRRFSADEREQAETIVDRAADAVECWCGEGMDTAMNRFNLTADQASD